MYDNTNRGALFKNEKKEKDNQPDYTGSVNINGVDMRLSAWIKQAKSGKNYMSLSVSELQDNPNQNQSARPQPSSNNESVPIEDIPF